MSRLTISFLRGIALGVVASAITDGWVAFLVVLLALVAAFALTDEVTP